MLFPDNVIYDFILLFFGVSYDVNLNKFDMFLDLFDFFELTVKFFSFSIFLLLKFLDVL